MAQPRQWFEEKPALGTQITFTGRYQGKWQLTELLYQDVWERTKEQEERFGTEPHARGVFRCEKRDQAGKGRKGQIRIWIQSVIIYKSCSSFCIS